MTFLDLVKRRYSVRAYRPDPVPDDLLATVLEAGRLAPTAANKQPFRIIVVQTHGRETELRSRLTEELQVIYEDIERSFASFYQHIEQEERELLPLLECFGQLENQLGTVRREIEALG